MGYRAPKPRTTEQRPRPRDIQLLAWSLDAWVGGEPPVEDIWTGELDARGLARRKAKPRPTPSGSWNIPVVAMADLAVIDDGEEAWDDLATYCDAQLGEDRLWGREILSSEYCFPPIVVALCLQVAIERGRSGIAKKLRKLVDAHALLMGLCALPRPHADAELRSGFPFHVCAPGMRNMKGYDVGVWRDNWLGCMLIPPAKRGAVPRTGWFSSRSHAAWVARISRATGAMVSEDDRQLIMEHIRNGNRSVEIVDRLNALGVTLQAPLHVMRFPGGNGCAWFTRDTSVTRAPTLAESRAGDEYRPLHLHPQKFAAEGGKKIGRGTCRLVESGAELVVRFEDYKPSPQSAGKTLEGFLAVPGGDPLYHALMDDRRAQLVKPPKEEPREEPREEPERPEDWRQDLAAARQRINRVGGSGLRYAKPLRTVSAVLFRIEAQEQGRQAEAPASIGAKTLTRQLEELESD